MRAYQEPFKRPSVPHMKELNRLFELSLELPILAAGKPTKPDTRRHVSREGGTARERRRPKHPREHAPTVPTYSHEPSSAPRLLHHPRPHGAKGAWRSSPTPMKLPTLAPQPGGTSPPARTKGEESHHILITLTILLRRNRETSQKFRSAFVHCESVHAHGCCVLDVCLLLRARPMNDL